VELLESVSLPGEASFLRRFPRQLSVGLAQRVLIAMAIMHRPSLLLADEPTSALDIITQSEILRLFAALNRDLDMGMLFISHDLLSVSTLCHRVAILHEGEIVECAPAEQIFQRPRHPYTQRLVAALPSVPAHSVL
jgi:ABC-type dipeptide/oligopeptide/nickel transport system ATPase component